MKTIVVDPEFQSLLPPLTDEELHQLEVLLVVEGCREALVVWDQEDGTSILVDGHNRYTICQKHSLGFKTVTCDIDSRAEAKAWIIRNNLGRRNLTAAQKVELALMLEPDLKEEARKRQATSAPGVYGGKPLVANLSQAVDSPAPKVRDQIASIANVSPHQVDKVRKVLNHGTPELAQAMRRGEVSIDAAARVSTLPAEEQRQAVAEGPKAVKQKALESRVKNNPTVDVPADNLKNEVTRATEQVTPRWDLVTEAWQFVQMAKANLSRIRQNDPKALEAIDEMIGWLTVERSKYV